MVTQPWRSAVARAAASRPLACHLPCGLLQQLLLPAPHMKAHCCAAAWPRCPQMRTWCILVKWGWTSAWVRGLQQGSSLRPASHRARQRLGPMCGWAHLAAATQCLLFCPSHRSPTRPPRAGHLELRPDAKAPGYPSAYLKENVIKARDGLVSAVGSSGRRHLVTDVLP